MMNSKIFFGFHVVNILIHYKKSYIDKIFYNDKLKNNRINNILILAKKKNIICKKISSYNFLKKIKYKKNILIKIKKFPKNRYNINKNNFLLILDNIMDSHNLGSCIRTANAVGIQAIITSISRSIKLNKDIVRISTGGIFFTPYIRVNNIINYIKYLKKKNVFIIGADSKSKINLFNYKFPNSIAIILGSEYNGIKNLTKKNCDILIKIPMLGEVNQLNLSVALGIFSYEIIRQKLFNNNV